MTMRTWAHRRLRQLGRDSDREHGFVAVFLAITLTTMLIFAAFTVDFGSWYTRAAELKRAADAAALAGVVWMPEFDQAQQYALAAAAKNGFVNGQNNITITVEDIPNNNRQLKVTIRDAKAKQFFSKLVTQSQSIGRSSVAEYVMPVPLGSPENVFGTGNLTLTNQPAKQNFWAAVSGYCSGHESGDKKLSKYESYSSSSSSSACNNNSPASDDDYDAEGYLYAIDVPTNITGTMKLEVYDGQYDTSSSSPSDGELVDGQTITTTYKIYDRNTTPLDLSNLTLLKTVNVPTNSSTYDSTWVNLNSWTNPKAGSYYVRVITNSSGLSTPETTNSRGSNGFGLRAYIGSSFSTCSTISTATNYSATCPQLHAVSDMSIFANISNATSDFYLAQIDPIHAGKTMRINLFDAGEGATTLQILDPLGAPSAFSWSTPCNPPTAPSGGCSGTASGSTPSLSVSGTGTQPYDGSPTWSLHSPSKYNDRFITIDIPLPNNYSTVYNGKVWWKVRYTVTGCQSDGTGCPTDRTTWSVNIVGDPVHLLQ
jgi:Putative Flp pilus-assembly TadE/G-like